MQSDSLILRIAVPSPLRHSFDYLPSANFDITALMPGMRVRVPFGWCEVVGVLLEVTNETQVSVDKLKRVIEILDKKPILPPQLLKLGVWASNYYHHSLGEVLLQAMPKLLRNGKAERIPDVIAQSVELRATDICLNEHQQLAVTAIKNQEGFQPFLLDGITGSGKTEVYLQVIAELIQAGKQALVLVPEIGLTPQIVQRFKQRFVANIVNLHSKLSEGERRQAWLQASHGLAPIVIGTRSAIFTPLPNLGIIILDEEHDLSFKQQSGFRYHARDLAIMRGKLENVPVVLGSATPSLESLYNVKRKRYKRLRLPERAGSAVHPSFHVLDLRRQKLTAGLSSPLIKQIERHLHQEGQVLLFLNRRGYAPTLLCHSCGWIAECDKCDARMTLHQNPNYLHCHHCDATHVVYKECPQCKSDQLLAIGVGTERIEENLQKIFPEIRLVRIDRDTTNRKGSMQQMLQDIHGNNYQILLGTQMLAKGHHFPNVTMSTIVDVDSGLFSSDFRAEEHMAQLIMQVAGRAGRAEKEGEVYIQTHNPRHPLLLQLIQQGYHKFAAETLRMRRKILLPPFTYFALIHAASKIKKDALVFLEEIKSCVPKDNTQILGPIPAPLQRKAGYYRVQLLINNKNRTQLHKLLDILMEQAEKLKSARKVRWSLDVDPLDMF